VGFITDARKDFGGTHSVLVASAFTLGRDANLRRLDPDNIGLVIVDEATFALAPTWRRILAHLGFLNADGGLVRRTDRFLLGLTADPYSLREIFGAGALIPSESLQWFIARKYLHHIVGERVRTRLRFVDQRDGNELIAAPDANAAYGAEVVACYQDRLDRLRTLLFVTTIAHAVAVQAAFDQLYGAGYAQTVTSETDEDEVDGITERFNAGTGATVLISIRKLQYGARLRADAVLHGYERSSLRGFGQSTMRAAGIGPGDVQRTIRCVTMRGAGHTLQPATLSRLFGVFDHDDDGLIFDPLHIPRQGSRRAANGKRRAPTPIPSTVGLFSFAYEETALTEDPSAVAGGNAWSAALHASLQREFGGDVIAMADRCDCDLDELDRYLRGELPTSLARVRAIEAQVQHAPDFEHLWLESMLACWEKIYTTDQLAPAPKALVRLVRRAILRVGDGSISSAVGKSTTENNWEMPGLKQIYTSALRIVVQGNIDTVYENSKVVRRAIRWLRGLPPGASNETIVDAALNYARIMSRPVRPENIPFDDVIEWEPTAQRDAFRHGLIIAFTDMREMDALLEFAGFSTQDATTADTTPDAMLQFRDLAIGVRSALATLPGREEKVMRMRFGIGEKEAESLEEIAQDFFVTQERIKQIEAKALRKMKQPSRARLLVQFFKDVGVADFPRKKLIRFLEKIAQLGHAFGFTEIDWTSLLRALPRADPAALTTDSDSKGAAVPWTVSFANFLAPLRDTTAVEAVEKILRHESTCTETERQMLRTFFGSPFAQRMFWPSMTAELTDVAVLAAELKPAELSPAELRRESLAIKFAQTKEGQQIVRSGVDAVMLTQHFVTCMEERSPGVIYRRQVPGIMLQRLAAEVARRRTCAAVLAQLANMANRNPDQNYVPHKIGRENMTTFLQWVQQRNMDLQDYLLRS